ncbi:ATP-binding protein [Amycolatopsis sp. NPDC054798]
MYRGTPDPSTERTDDADAAHTAAPAGAAAPIDPSVRSSFEELVPALPEAAAALRRKLKAWLEELPLDSDSCHEIVLAAYEALANVVVHAYPERSGWARLYAEWAGDTVRATVTDTGRGMPPRRGRTADPAAPGGRGLRIIDEVTDQMTVESGARGTRVTMVWRPAALRQNTAS